MDKAARAALLTAKGIDNKSENIADYVADLLRQGRAKEVTDDLMEQADPQRLHQHYTSGNTGMNLPMDYASRMERAAKMGFRTDLFHGTHKDFPAFDERPIYASNNPNVASTYASPTLGNIMPLAMRGGENSPVMNAAGGNWNRLSRSMRENENAPILEKKQPTQHDINFGVVKDGEVLGTTQSFSKAAKAQGYNGMTFNDVKDKGVWAAGPKVKIGNPEYEAARLAEKSAKQPSTVEVRFDPTNIRSQFARFDPRLGHLAHLSASTGGAMEFARHVEAVHRAGGQIAPSKYLPNVPRAVHAGGGKVDFIQGNHPLVPDVLYHGTARDIRSFDPDAKRSYDVEPSNPAETDTGWFGKGHYFTASPKLAAYYANEGAKRQGHGGGANIMPAHVAMKNPLVVDMKAYDSGAKTLDKALNGMGVPMHPRGWRKPSEQTAALIAMGHDGVIATREGKPEEYVAFHPHQIKSAIGNQGTFDPNDPDITKAGGGDVEGDENGITAYHGSPHSFDQFDISKLGTGEGNQSYGHGLYFAGNEKVAKYYRDALTDPEQTHLHFDQRPVDTPWNEEIRARWPEHFAGKSQRDQDAMEEALGNLSQVNNLKDVPNALSNMSAAAKYMYQRHIKPKLTKPDLGKGHMYKVKINVKPEELLDWDKPLSEQHPNIQRIAKEAESRSGVIKFRNGHDLHDFLSNHGRDQKQAADYLQSQGLKGIRYKDADSRDLSDGDATHNYVMFHHDPVQVVDKYEYGGAIPKARDVSAALALTRRFTKDGNAATASLKKKPL